MVHANTTQYLSVSISNTKTRNMEGSKIEHMIFLIGRVCRQYNIAMFLQRLMYLYSAAALYNLKMWHTLLLIFKSFHEELRGLSATNFATSIDHIEWNPSDVSGGCIELILNLLEPIVGLLKKLSCPF